MNLNQEYSVSRHDGESRFGAIYQLSRRSVITLLGMLVLTVSTVVLADQVIATGERARALYNRLPGPVKGPYCTGACIPGKPCDSSCTSSKNGNGYYCIEERSLKSGALRYACYSKQNVLDSENVDATNYQINEGHNGSNFAIAAGNYLTLRLVSNPSTAYDWAIQGSTYPLQLVGSSKESTPGGGVGRPVTNVYRFRVGVGRGRLLLNYQRFGAPVKTFSVFIEGY